MKTTEATPPSPPTPEQQAEEDRKNQEIIADRQRRTDEAKLKAKNKKAAEDEAARLAALPPPPLAISEIPWKELDLIYSAKSKATDIVKNEKWKSYRGKRVRWAGIVGEIQKEMLGESLLLSVKMNNNSFMSDLVITLRSDQVNKAFKLAKDDRVFFETTLKEWGTILPVVGEDGVITAIQKRLQHKSEDADE